MPLSQKQMEYLALVSLFTSLTSTSSDRDVQAWQCFETEPKIDYAKFHRLAGLASEHSARELMRVTKNKLKTEYGALGAGLQAANANGSVPSTPAKATPAKGRNKGATPAGTPAKTPGSTGGKRGGKKSRAEMMEDDDEVLEEPKAKKVNAEQGQRCEAAGAEAEADAELGDEIFD